MSEEERTEEIREAAGEVEKSVAAKESAEASAPKARSHAGKGLMERRASFSQSSVPNAHRGYSGRTPRVMMVIIAVLFITSFILAGITT